jgi:hypothetical protein
MRLSTGQLIKRGDIVNWGLIGAASCVIHVAGVTTQKGCDVEFLFYNGLILSQREAIVVQEPTIQEPVSSSTTAPIIDQAPVVTTPTIENTTSTVSYVGGVPGNWIDNPEWTSLNQKIQEIQKNQAQTSTNRNPFSFNPNIFSNMILKQYQATLATLQRYIFVPLK